MTTEQREARHHSAARWGKDDHASLLFIAKLETFDRIGARFDDEHSRSSSRSAAAALSFIHDAGEHPVACSGGGSATDGGTDGGTGDALITGDSGITCGTATMLASGQMNPGGITVSGGKVVWTTCPKCLGNLDGMGDIMTVATSGGTPTVFATNQDNSASITSDATNVYWSAPTDGNIVKAALAGGAPSNLFQNVNSPEFIAVDATYVYWVATAPYTLVRGPLAGGSREKLANVDGSSRNVAVNASAAFWIVQADNDMNNGVVNAVGFGGADAGAAITALASMQSPAWIAADATNVYWPNLGNTGASPTPGAIMKVAVGGGAPTTLSTRPGMNVPGIVAIDSANIYWIETNFESSSNASGLVFKMPLGGGTPTCIAPGPELSFGLTVDATSVYWTGNDGNVMKASK